MLLADMLAGILMDLRGLMDDFALVKKVRREGSYENFETRIIYASPMRGLERLIRKETYAMRKI